MKVECKKSDYAEDFNFVFPKLTYIGSSKDFGNCFGKQMLIEWDDFIFEDKAFGIPREPV